MALEQRDKELAAIGASIGANCRPCIEHHLVAGREAGLSDAELNDAVATARAARREAVELLSARIDELLGRGGPPLDPAAAAQTSKARELVALGVSVGANSHPSAVSAHRRRTQRRARGPSDQVGAQDGRLRPTTAAEITANEVTRALAEVGAPAEPITAN